MVNPVSSLSLSNLDHFLSSDNVSDFSCLSGEIDIVGFLLGLHLFGKSHKLIMFFETFEAKMVLSQPLEMRPPTLHDLNVFVMLNLRFDELELIRRRELADLCQISNSDLA